MKPRARYRNLSMPGFPPNYATKTILAAALEEVALCLAPDSATGQRLRTIFTRGDRRSGEDFDCEELPPVLTREEPIIIKPTDQEVDSNEPIPSTSQGGVIKSVPRAKAESAPRPQRASQQEMFSQVYMHNMMLAGAPPLGGPPGHPSLPEWAAMLNLAAALSQNGVDPKAYSFPLMPFPMPFNVPQPPLHNSKKPSIVPSNSPPPPKCSPTSLLPSQSSAPLDLSRKTGLDTVDVEMKLMRPPAGRARRRTRAVCAPPPLPPLSLDSPLPAAEQSTTRMDEDAADEPQKNGYALKRNYSQVDLDLAVNDIRCGRLGTRRASVVYGIPRSTLRNKIYKLEAADEQNGVTPPYKRRRAGGQSSAEKMIAEAVELCSKKKKEMLNGLRATSASRTSGPTEESPPAHSPAPPAAAAARGDHIDATIAAVANEDFVVGESEVSPPLDLSMNADRAAADPDAWINELEKGEWAAKVWNELRDAPGSDNASESSHSSHITADESSDSGCSSSKRHSEEPPANTTTIASEALVVIAQPAAAAAPAYLPESAALPLPLMCAPPLLPPMLSSPGGNVVSTGHNSNGLATVHRNLTLESWKKQRPKRGQYRKYDKQALDEAVQSVRRGEMSVHRAGSYYGVPHSTLEYKVKERNLLRPRKTDELGRASDEENSSSSSSESSASDGMPSPVPEENPLDPSRFPLQYTVKTEPAN